MQIRRSEREVRRRPQKPISNRELRAGAQHDVCCCSPQRVSPAFQLRVALGCSSRLGFADRRLHSKWPHELWGFFRPKPRYIFFFSCYSPKVVVDIVSIYFPIAHLDFVFGAAKRSSALSTGSGQRVCTPSIPLPSRPERKTARKWQRRK